MINLWILLILTSAIAAKDSGAPLFLGLILLAIQTYDFEVEPKKIIVTEILIALALSIAAVIQLVVSKSFGLPQALMITLLLGGIVVTVEAVRKYQISRKNESSG